MLQFRLIILLCCAVLCTSCVQGITGRAAGAAGGSVTAGISCCSFGLHVGCLITTIHHQHHQQYHQQQQQLLSIKASPDTGSCNCRCHEFLMNRPALPTAPTCITAASASLLFLLPLPWLLLPLLLLVVQQLLAALLQPPPVVLQVRVSGGCHCGLISIAGTARKPLLQCSTSCKQHKRKSQQAQYTSSE